jgi:hypothetical protein
VFHANEEGFSFALEPSPKRRARFIAAAALPILGNTSLGGYSFSGFTRSRSTSSTIVAVPVSRIYHPYLYPPSSCVTLANFALSSEPTRILSMPPRPTR